MPRKRCWNFYWNRRQRTEDTGLRIEDGHLLWLIYLLFPLVLFPGDIVMFRAKQRRQDKAQSAENGESFSRTATQYWRRCLAPCGRAGKRSPAALRRLARARHYLHGAPGAQPLPGPLNMTISPGKSTSFLLKTGVINPGIDIDAFSAE